MVDRPRRLLIVHHSRSGNTAALRDAVVDGANAGAGDSVSVSVLHAFDAEPNDVLGAGAVLLTTPANFGYMSGALKDFFERIYHPCLDATAGLPYGLVVKGDTDTSGAVASVERIVTGLRWRPVRPPLAVTGPTQPADIDAAFDLGAAVAAGLAEGLL